MRLIRILILVASLVGGLLLPAITAAAEVTTVIAPCDCGPLTPDDPGFGVK